MLQLKRLIHLFDLFISRAGFLQWWVSSTPFRVPFHVLVPFRNRGIISNIICKWSVQKTFQQYFSIFSKSVCYVFYLKKNVAFTLISFGVLKWHDCLSVQLPVELPVQLPVQLRAQLFLALELNWSVQNGRTESFPFPFLSQGNLGKFCKETFPRIFKSFPRFGKRFTKPFLLLLKPFLVDKWKKAFPTFPLL